MSKERYAGKFIFGTLYFFQNNPGKKQLVLRSVFIVRPFLLNGVFMIFSY
jgi:hypothetical protein